MCGVNLEEVYGKIGKDFIHVHHIKPISEYGENHEADAINDLITVCPNCHAMLHRTINNISPSVEELRLMLIENKKISNNAVLFTNKIVEKKRLKKATK